MKEWVTIFARYGFAGLVAGVLLYVVVGQVMASQSRLLDEHAAMRTEITSVKEITGQSDMAQQQILYVLQTMCVNAAKTDYQRSECLRQIDTRTR